jgi:hypothetical protein
MVEHQGQQSFAQRWPVMEFRFELLAPSAQQVETDMIGSPLNFTPLPRRWGEG